MKKPLLKSNTTKTMAIAGAGSLGIVGIILSMARKLAPQFVVWGPEGDAAIQTAVASVIVPLISRWMARRRKRKADRRTRRRNLAGLPVALLIAGLAIGGVLQGCKTTTSPDGTVIQQVDIATLWQVYEDYIAEQQRLIESGVQRDIRREAQRQARMAEIAQAASTAWQALLDAGIIKQPK